MCLNYRITLILVRYRYSILNASLFFILFQKSSICLQLNLLSISLFNWLFKMMEAIAAAFCETKPSESRPSKSLAKRAVDSPTAKIRRSRHSSGSSSADPTASATACTHLVLLKIIPNTNQNNLKRNSFFRIRWFLNPYLANLFGPKSVFFSGKI